MSSILFALGEDTTALRVSYEAPPACPVEAAFFDAIQARTDHVRRATSDEDALEVNVHVTRTDRGFVGEVRETVNHTESSARTVDGATCKEVVEALSLTIALSVDPNAHAPVAKRPEPQKPAPLCPHAPEPPRVATPPVPSALELELGVGVVATEALASDFSAGGAVSGALLRKTSERMSASLELSLLFAKTGVLASPVDHETRLEGLLLDGCPARFEFGSIELGPCLLAEVGVLDATGRGVSEPATIERGWWSAGLDFQLAAILGHGFVFESALGATVPFVKRRFYLSVPDQVIAESPGISPLLRVGLGFRY